jgi:hypothetical protein
MLSGLCYLIIYPIYITRLTNFRTVQSDQREYHINHSIKSLAIITSHWAIYLMAMLEPSCER